MTTDALARRDATIAALVRKLRVFTYAGVSLCIAASILGAVLVGTGWSWPLFGWGVLIGPLWVAGTAAIYRYAGRYVLGAPPLTRFGALYPAWAAMGVPFGVGSAAFETAAPDVGLSIYAFLAMLLPLARMRGVRRRYLEATNHGRMPE